MATGFVIEFSTVTWFSDDGDERNTVHRFRVLVAGESVTAYVAHPGPFADDGWVRVVDDPAQILTELSPRRVRDLDGAIFDLPREAVILIGSAAERYRAASAANADHRSRSWLAPLDENRIIALAFDGYVRAGCETNPSPRTSELPNGLTLIDIGTVKREA